MKHVYRGWVGGQADNEPLLGEQGGAWEQLGSLSPPGSAGAGGGQQPCVVRGFPPGCGQLEEGSLCCSHTEELKMK